MSFFSKLRNLNLKTGVELRTKLIECSGLAGCLLNLSTTIIVSIPPESLAITRILMLGFVEMSSIIHRLHARSSWRQKGRNFEVTFISTSHSAYIILRIIMPFCKSCHMPFPRKPIPSFSPTSLSFFFYLSLIYSFL